jgi:hypothetical protein
MQDRPNPEELLEAVAAFLRDHLVSGSASSQVAFHARVAANALDIARRQATLAPGMREREHAALRADAGRRGAGRVHADQPVGLGARACRRFEVCHLLARAQLLERIADRGLGHRVDPQPLHRLLRLGLVVDVGEDQLAFAPGVTGVDDCAHVFAFDQPAQHREPGRILLDRHEVKLFRKRRQVLHLPLAFGRLEAGGRPHGMLRRLGAAMLPALVLGDTSALTGETTSEFRASGLTHLTAVSGANVTIVAPNVPHCGIRTC